MVHFTMSTPTIEQETRRRIATELTSHFMPTAALCDCGGTNTRCRQALSDPLVRQQILVVERIVEWLNSGNV